MTKDAEHSLVIPHFPPVWAEVFGEDDCGIFAECEVKEVRFVWRWICPGKFQMGSPENEIGRWSEEGPSHEVVLTRGFWLGETPVTRAQWQAVTGESVGQFDGEQRPVESVSWHQCCAFAERLNEVHAGLNATLPSEAQWEYACRAGTSSAFNNGSNCTRPDGKDSALDMLGWYDQNSGGETHQVKSGKAPNVWGLHDMHGNVWEWCRDAWDKHVYSERSNGILNPERISEDPLAERVLRGGSWGAVATACRSAFRYYSRPDMQFWSIGFRLAANHEPASAQTPFSA